MVGDGNRAVREEMERVIRRLNVLEYLILGAAALMALGGGALTALLLKESFGSSFRTAWFVSSLLLFLVPGVFVLRKESKQGDSPSQEKPSKDNVDG